MLLTDMEGEYQARLPTYANFSIYNVFHALEGFEENFVRLIFSTMDLIAYHLLESSNGLPKHLRAEPKEAKDVKGAKLMAVEKGPNTRRGIESILDVFAGKNNLAEEITLKVKWMTTRKTDDPDRLYPLTPVHDDEYYFLADSTTASTIC